MRRGTLDIVYGLLLASIGGFLFWETTDPKYADTMGLGVASNPAFYPRILLAAWVGLSVILMLRGALAQQEVVPAPQVGRLAATIGLVALYTGAIFLIGFLFASILLCAALMVVLGFRHPLLVAVIATAGPLAIWYTFVFLLRIPLPTSPWFRTL